MDPPITLLSAFLSALLLPRIASVAEGHGSAEGSGEAGYPTARSKVRAPTGAYRAAVFEPLSGSSESLLLAKKLRRRRSAFLLHSLKEG